MWVEDQWLTDIIAVGFSDERQASSIAIGAPLPGSDKAQTVATYLTLYHKATALVQSQRR
jgi:hypothetical protein